MKVNSIDNQVTNPNFGHSFRVSICLKNESGCGDYFVSPSSNKRLYRTLNSKIVELLNADYYENLRNVFGITRKNSSNIQMNSLSRGMIDELKNIDTDYSKFQYTRTVPNGGRLGYIVTGGDVSIIENIKGLKNIGLAKADPFWSNESEKSNFIKSLCKSLNDSVKDFVKHDNVLLRSKEDREIILRVVFKEIGKYTTGSPKYELDRYEFQEVKKNPILKAVDEKYAKFKQSAGMLAEIKKTVNYHLNRLLKKKVHFTDENMNAVVRW